MAAELQRRRGRPAIVTIGGGTASVRVGGVVFSFSIGRANRLNAVGDTRALKGSEDFAYAQSLIRNEF